MGALMAAMWAVSTDSKKAERKVAHLVACWVGEKVVTMAVCWAVYWAVAWAGYLDPWRAVLLAGLSVVLMVDQKDY